MIPYGRQTIDEEDIQAVVAVLRSDWLTTGPKVDQFEKAFSEEVGAKHAIAVNSGTAALHACMFAAGIGPDDEVIVPAITFAATANCAVYQGGIPVFADVDPDTLLIDPNSVESRITGRTKAIIAVDYAGQPCDYDILNEMAERHRIMLISDACHSLGGMYKGKKVGTLASMSAFSFHPVKHVTTGEGGMIACDSQEIADRMRMFRSHGISTSLRQREIAGSWFYEMCELGYNYRITDIQCALGLSQLKKLSVWVERRRAIARMYDHAFESDPRVKPLSVRKDARHAYHLYVVRIGSNDCQNARTESFKLLREMGVGVNVHYIPVHLHPFYMKRFQTRPGMCPVAEKAYGNILSLPMYPGMTDEMVDFVVQAVKKVSSSSGIVK